MGSGDGISDELRIFLLESYEIVDLFEQGLMELEAQPSSGDVLHGLFRSIHTIKGNSGFFGFAALEGLCHRGEGLLDGARSGALALGDGQVSALFSLVDSIREILSALESTGSEPAADYTELLSRLSV